MSGVVTLRSRREQVGKTSGYGYIKARGRIRGDVWGHGGSDPHAMEDFRNFDQTMRGGGEIGSLWGAAGIRPEKKIAFYCGTGWRASEAFFYAYVMGFKHISVYDGGWLKWSRDKNNPVASGHMN